MSGYTFKEAKRRYQAFFWPCMAVYAFACIGGAILQRQFETTPAWLSAGFAILTVAPVLLVLWLIWRYAQETDEYTRMRQLEALAIGGLVSAGISGVIGFLQLYETIPTFPVFFGLPFFFLAYGGAKIFRGDRTCD